MAWRDSVVAIGRLGWLAVGLIAGLLLAFIGELRRYGGHYHATLNMGLSMFGIAYIGGLMGFMVQLRMLSGAPWGSDGRWGMLALVSLIATVKMSDTGQYTFGRLVRPAQTGAGRQPGQDVGRRGGRRTCRGWHGVARVYAGCAR